MNNWLSPQLPNYTFSLSNNNKIFLPVLPETPIQPVTRVPQANPPIIFIPDI